MRLHPAEMFDLFGLPRELRDCCYEEMLVPQIDLPSKAERDEVEKQDAWLLARNIIPSSKSRPFASFAIRNAPAPPTPADAQPSVQQRIHLGGAEARHPRYPPPGREHRQKTQYTGVAGWDMHPEVVNHDCLLRSATK